MEIKMKCIFCGEEIRFLGGTPCAYSLDGFIIIVCRDRDIYIKTCRRNFNDFVIFENSNILNKGYNI